VIFMVKRFQRQRLSFARSTTSSPRPLITALIMYGVSLLGHFQRGGGQRRELALLTTVSIRTGADEPVVRTAFVVVCWHQSGGNAADTSRTRLAGVLDVRSLRTARRLEAPAWLAQLYKGTIVHMDKGWKGHTNVCIVVAGEDRLPPRWRMRLAKR